MALAQLTDDQALALSGVTDSRTGLVYPTLFQARWAEAIYRALNQFVSVCIPDLRVLGVDGNNAAVAVLPGVCTIDGVMLEYAGSAGAAAVSSLSDNATHFIWAQKNGSDVQIASATSTTGWPAGDHVKLARVVRAGGVITSITDLRGSAAFDRLPAATTALRGGVKQAAAVADLDQTISDPPTQAQVQALSDKVDALLASLRTAGVLASS